MSVLSCLPLKSLAEEIIGWFEKDECKKIHADQLTIMSRPLHLDFCAMDEDWFAKSGLESCVVGKG